MGHVMFGRQSSDTASAQRLLGLAVEVAADDTLPDYVRFGARVVADQASDEIAED
jgi:hypothetical protein